MCPRPIYKSLRQPEVSWILWTRSHGCQGSADPKTMRNLCLYFGNIFSSLSIPFKSVGQGHTFQIGRSRPYLNRKLTCGKEYSHECPWYVITCCMKASTTKEILQQSIQVSSDITFKQDQTHIEIMRQAIQVSISQIVIASRHRS